jgi:hypothetical protein
MIPNGGYLLIGGLSALCFVLVLWGFVKGTTEELQ